MKIQNFKFLRRVERLAFFGYFWLHFNEIKIEK